ncbi:MAG: hypothetical protein WBB45_05715 [Cyclobacteriaceae bacterium]
MSNSKVARTQFFSLLEEVAGKLRLFEAPRASVAYWKKLKLYNDAAEVYESLGGRERYIPFICQTDLMVTDSHLVILDEDLSYNRYRSKTLRNQVYDNLPGAQPDHLRRYCRQYESECMKAGMRHDLWTSPEAEAHFGEASDPGEFYGTGASGWKLRAFTEHITDIMSLYSGTPVIRFSVYDNLMVEGRILQVRDLLMTSADERYPEFLKSYMKRKLETVSA